MSQSFLMQSVRQASTYLDPRRACGAGSEHHVNDCALVQGKSTNIKVQH